MPRSDQAGLLESDLKQQLDAKDQLVRALTDRLEEAAEQLDRVHRTGGDKTGRAGGSSDAGSHPLIEKLNRSLELWEDVEPRDAFARIEERLDELRSMLEGAIVGSSGETQPPKKKDALSGWEKMKAELMGDLASSENGSSSRPATASSARPQAAAPHVPPQQSEHTPSDQSGGSSNTPAAATAPPPPLDPPRPLTELQLPEPVDLEIAPRAELVDGIEVREQYIAELTRRLRSAESRTHQPIDWEVLNNAPGKLREALQHLESELTDRLRIAEVDLSLERARLSRVETRIRATQMQIEKKLQQSVGTDPANAKKTGASKGESSGKSWFGARGK